jgi:hypothetical protein
MRGEDFWMPGEELVSEPARSGLGSSQNEARRQKERLPQGRRRTRQD